ncbi:MAG: ABC transporter permease [Prolixibacteraceae bacterium]
MMKNFFKVGFRNILKNKLFSAINIFGLAIGLSTCIVIILFIRHELSYDRFHEKADRIVRVVFRGSVQGEKMNEAHVMPPVAGTLLAEFPEVEEATRLRSYGTPKVANGEKVFRDNSFAFVDDNFFRVFSLPLIKGDAENVLTRPNTVVISESTAAKYFGQEEPIGKVLGFPDWNAEFTITGVMKDVPENSHFEFDLFASMATFPESENTSWMESEFHTYLVLSKGSDYRDLEAKLPAVTDRHMSPQIKEAMGISLDAFREAGNNIGLFLQPLADIHLHSGSSGDLKAGGDVRYISIFGAVALLMMIIATINFINLSTAGATNRLREVGVRKVMGSCRFQLIGQFMTESVLLALIALAAALLLVKVTLPGFSNLTTIPLETGFSGNPLLLPVLFLIAIVAGVVAGCYPGFFISSFKPVSILKGGALSGFPTGNKGGIRSGLVVLQFIISIGLIICTMAVYLQLEYIQSKQLGYEKEQVMILPDVELLRDNKETFRNLLLQDPRVINVSTSGYLPAGPTFNNNFFIFPDDDVSRQIKALRYDVDEHYIDVMNMHLLEGRNLSSQFASDSASIIVNETAAKALGWKNNAVGQIVTHSDNNGKRKNYKVIGVVKDFHFKSLRELISPLVMVLNHDAGSVIVKAETTDMAALVAYVEQQWVKFNPGEPFACSFLDEHYDKAYQAEKQLGLLIGFFASLTIVVACMGLLGLALFTAGQRRKEIGIRKVNGARISEILIMLNRDFVKWVLIAFVIATPVAWYAMHKWLENFAYKTELNWWIFALAGLLALGIALLTVSWQSWKAATRNPVEALRYE